MIATTPHAATAKATDKAIEDLEKYLSMHRNDTVSDLTARRVAYRAAFHKVKTELPAKITAAEDAAQSAASATPANLEEARRQEQLKTSLVQELRGSATTALRAASTNLMKPIRLERECKRTAALLDDAVTRHAKAKEYGKAAQAAEKLKTARRLLRELRATSEWTSLRAQFSVRELNTSVPAAALSLEPDAVESEADKLELVRVGEEWVTAAINDSDVARVAWDTVDAARRRVITEIPSAIESHRAQQSQHRAKAQVLGTAAKEAARKDDTVLAMKLRREKEQELHIAEQLEISVQELEMEALQLHDNTDEDEQQLMEPYELVQQIHVEHKRLGNVKSEQIAGLDFLGSAKTERARDSLSAVAYAIQSTPQYTEAFARSPEGLRKAEQRRKFQMYALLALIALIALMLGHKYLWRPYFGAYFQVHDCHVKTLNGTYRRTYDDLYKAIYTNGNGGKIYYWVGVDDRGKFSCKALRCSDWIGIHCRPLTLRRTP
mmetsp:Transcript_12345/g.37068  ORF Transcript_12345/g.37068 Transcript_12345/m.37068 type:complete len:493 (-) Transcript_12345:44-1522(-)